MKYEDIFAAISHRYDTFTRMEQNIADYVLAVSYTHLDVYKRQDLGRVTYDVIGDKDTIDAFFTLSRMEGIIPAIESAHAVAYAMQLAKRMKRGSILILSLIHI